MAVVSTGGTASVDVTVPQLLTGLYQGEVHITDPADLGTRSFAVVLRQDDNGKLAGYVRPYEQTFIHNSTHKHYRPR